MWACRRLVSVSAVVFGSLALAGCNPIAAIAVSNPSLDFGLNERPLFIDVWNNNPEAGRLDIRVRSNVPWIVTDVTEVASDAPAGEAGPFDKRSVEVSIDRRILNRGTHTGDLIFSASGVETVRVPVRVQQNTDGPGDSFAFGEQGVSAAYGPPYLIDFRFSLRDGRGDPVVAEPEQFALSAVEGTEPIGPETGLRLNRSAARQLKLELVLDYSLNLQSSSGAIAAMEDAAIGELLTALNEDALVGVTEFHRDDRSASRVVPFSVDRAFAATGIQSIQEDIVAGFFSGSRIYDAIVSAVRAFRDGDAAAEARYILLFSDGNDTSSTAAANRAIADARNAGVRIYAIAFGDDPDVAALQNLTASTGGEYFEAAEAGDLGEVFRTIVDDLQAQYTVRWATLKRGENRFTPAFTLGLGPDTVTYRGPAFEPDDHDGNPLEGWLKMVPSNSETRTTVFLRAEYIPRFVRRLRIRFDSANEFSLRQVGFADDGLVAGWSLELANDPAGGVWVSLESPGDPLPFAGFGPLLRIDFTGIVPDGEPLFDVLDVDNSIYPNGQTFVVEGFDD